MPKSVTVVRDLRLRYLGYGSPARSDQSKIEKIWSSFAAVSQTD